MLKTNNSIMKLITTVLLISLSTALFGQADIISGLITDFERNKSMSLAYIEAMPEDKFNYKPGDDVRTFAEQFLHISQGLIGLSSNGTGADRLYGTQNIEKTDSFKSKSEVQRIVTESYDYVIASIKEMDKSTLDEVVERGPFSVTRLGWVMKALEHATHHKGQAAVYLRLNDIVPPQFQLF
jgi:uncharacterized damage-inducible protein DinB